MLLVMRVLLLFVPFSDRRSLGENHYQGSGILTSAFRVYGLGFCVRVYGPWVLKVVVADSGSAGASGSAAVAVVVVVTVVRNLCKSTAEQGHLVL